LLDSLLQEFQRRPTTPPACPYLILMERVAPKSDKNLSGLCKLVRNLLKPSMGSSMSVDQEEVPDQNYDFSYQVAMSNRIFSDTVSVSDLPCMNCLRVEMGERACYTGICEACGKTPPCLRWMYPDAPVSSSSSASSSSSRRHGRSHGGGGRSGRSSSYDRQMGPDGGRHARRRASVSSPSPSLGISHARIDLSTFTHTYNRVVGVDSEGSDKDSTHCVICLGDFRTGDNVRRLACLHLFHVNCVDNWLSRNRICPVCRVDIEAAAAQFR